jgi:hypothetical protein
MGENGVVASLARLAREATLAETGQTHKGKRPSRSSDQSFWGIGIASMYGSVSQQPPGGVTMRHALGWWWHTPHDTLDKIDEAFLERDTRVVLHTLWRLLTDRVLPIDPAAEVASLSAELAAIGGAAASELVQELLSAARAAERALSPLAAAPANERACKAHNEALLQICRALVPLDYAEGDRFAHDPALPQPAWPVLQSLRDLAAAESGSDEAKFLAVAAVRSRNRLLRALEDASSAVAALHPGQAAERLSSSAGTRS